MGYALASMIVCRPAQALTVTEINGSVRGGANTTDAHGEDSAIVDLGGIAAEQLVVGSGDCLAGASTDIKSARQSLRDDQHERNRAAHNCKTFSTQRPRSASAALARKTTAKDTPTSAACSSTLTA